MARKIPPLPAVRPGAQWPTMIATPADKAYVPRPVSAHAVALGQSVRWVIRSRGRMLRSAAKGIALGVIVASVVLGIVPAAHWWQGEWRWLGGGMIVVGIGGLLGIDAGILIATLIGLIQAIGSSTHLTTTPQPLPYLPALLVPVPTQVVIAPGFLASVGLTLGAAIVIRIVWEWLWILRGL